MMPENRFETARRFAEALALLCLEHGISAISGDGRLVRTAIAEAWRIWSGAERYPQYSAFSIAGMVWDEMSHPQTDRCNRAQWVGTAWLRPRSTSVSWSYDEGLASIAPEGTSVAELVELGAAFLEQFDDDDILRTTDAG